VSIDVNSHSVLLQDMAMPIHSHSSQKDPQRVIKEDKKAIEDGEGCQVIQSSVVYLFRSLLVVLSLL
jgi:hypothetical protein